jgi:hypothetical protein
MNSKVGIHAVILNQEDFHRAANHIASIHRCLPRWSEVPLPHFFDLLIVYHRRPCI